MFQRLQRPKETILQKVLVGERDHAQQSLDIVHGCAINLELAGTGTNSTVHRSQRIFERTWNTQKIGRREFGQEYLPGEQPVHRLAGLRKEGSRMVAKTYSRRLSLPP